jgi:hypothetical protein
MRVSDLNPEMLDNALLLAADGWAVFPAHGIHPTTKLCTCGALNCAQTGKHPATVHGLKNATSDEAGLRGLWGGREHLNVAVATGEISGLFVLDIDGHAGEMSLGRLGELPDTLTALTSNGRHLYFQHPGRKVHSRVKKLAEGIDVRGDGGYVIAPPSLHRSGVFYQWIDPTADVAPAPDWLIEAVCAEPVRVEHHHAPIDYDTEDLSVQDVRELLTYLDPDMPYDEWLHVGMALHAGKFHMGVWDEWSRRGKKYQNGDCLRRWRGFNPAAGITMGTLIQMARVRGWDKTIATPEDDGPHPAQAFLDKIRAQAVDGGTAAPVAIEPHEITTKAGELLLDPMNLPGLIGDTVRWIVDTSIKPQPELALLNTLSALGAIFGRRYATVINTRTNVYIVAVAESASGKEHSRQQIKRLLTKSGLETYLGGDDVRSPQGMITSLSKKASSVLMLDEFGKFIQGVVDTRGASHMKGFGRALMQLYSSSGSTFNAGAYSDPKIDPIILHCPNLCIYGTTTEATYTPALKREALVSGELNRFIVLPAPEEMPKRRDILAPNVSIPDDLISAWGTFKPGNVSELNSNSVVPDPIMIAWDETEGRVLALGHYEDRMIVAGKGEGTGLLWGRYRENVLKIAMIFAIARNPHVPAIKDIDLDIAEALVTSGIHYVQRLARDHMYETDVERNSKEVEHEIKRAGSITRSALIQKMRKLSVKDLDAILAGLLEQGAIEATQEKTNGRPRAIYRGI